VLLEQFRVGALNDSESAWLLEIVAGGIEIGETPEAVAYRESEEEAGCKIEELILIHDFYTSPGGASERLKLYCAKVDSTNIGGIHGLQSEDEDILVTTVSSEKLFDLLAQQQIKSAIPIIAAQWLALNKTKLQQQWLNS